MSGRTRVKGLAALVVLILGALAAYFKPPDATPERRGKPAEEREAPPVPKGHSFTGKIVGVHDGDTITLLWEKREIKVRLFGIDAPETNPAQDYGQRAKQYASQWMFGKEARVEVKDARLTYGRVVGEVFVTEEGKEQSVNAAMVDAGFAWAYRHYSEAFVEREAAARAAHRGLWADDNPVPPWEFRKEKHAE
ncbi:MAG: thermonuclease family protein [Planctomycetes bacterium]|nr:thermonuclease family protein [Planctomycetota bacterium]